MDPATASPYASYLTYMQIENAQDIIDGKQKTEALGVKGRMRIYTFVLTLSHPIPYLPSMTTHQSVLPLPKHIVEKFGDDWVKVENHVARCYKLTKHVINEKLNLFVTALLE